VGGSIVISDASPLIAIGRIDGLAWLRQVFGEVCIPPEVAAEVLPGRGLPGERALRTAVLDGWLRVLEKVPTEPMLPGLDEGEAACIRAAMACKGPALLLIDERDGRAAAAEQGLTVTGTAGVVAHARRHNLIPSARDVLERLHKADFRIDQGVLECTLRACGEWREP